MKSDFPFFSCQPNGALAASAQFADDVIATLEHITQMNGVKPAGCVCIGSFLYAQGYVWLTSRCVEVEESLVF